MSGYIMLAVALAGSASTAERLASLSARVTSALADASRLGEVVKQGVGANQILIDEVRALSHAPVPVPVPVPPSSSPSAGHQQKPAMQAVAGTRESVQKASVRRLQSTAPLSFPVQGLQARFLWLFLLQQRRRLELSRRQEREDPARTRRLPTRDTLLPTQVHELPSGSNTCPAYLTRKNRRVLPLKNGAPTFEPSAADVDASVALVSVGKKWNLTVIDTMPAPLTIVHDNNCSHEPTLELGLSTSVPSLSINGQDWATSVAELEARIVALTLPPSAPPQPPSLPPPNPPVPTSPPPIPPSHPNTPMWNTLTGLGYGGGWQLVRRIGPDETGWHPATDSLAGTSVYGSFPSANDPPKAANTFSIAFSHVAFDHFLFSTGDEAYWLLASKFQVIGEAYDPSTSLRLIIASSYLPTGAGYSVAWYNRDSTSEDPWISVRDHGSGDSGDGMLYGEASFDAHGKRKRENNGCNVWIRSACTPHQPHHLALWRLPFVCYGSDPPPPPRRLR